MTVTSAKVDTNGNAIEADAPDATILRPAATVTVSGYTVTLPDDFTRTDAPGSTIIEAGGNAAQDTPLPEIAQRRMTGFYKIEVQP